MLGKSRKKTPSNLSALVKAAADLNGDGKVDLVTIGNSLSSSGFEIRALLGKGDGTFSASAPVVTFVYSTDFAVGDFNGDGYDDLAVLHNSYGSFIDVLINDKQWGTKPRKW